MPTPHPTPGDSAVQHSDFLADLAAILTDDVVITMCFEGNGAVLSLRSPEKATFGEAVIARWKRLPPLGRALKVVQWIHEAADYRRSPRGRLVHPA